MHEDRGKHEQELAAVQELLADVQAELVHLQDDLQQMHTAAVQDADRSEEMIVAKALRLRSGGLFRLFRLATLHACGSLPAAWDELSALSTEAGRVNRVALQNFGEGLLGVPKESPVVEWVWAALDRRRKGEINQQ